MELQILKKKKTKYTILILYSVKNNLEFHWEFPISDIIF